MFQHVGADNKIEQAVYLGKTMMQICFDERDTGGQGSVAGKLYAGNFEASGKVQTADGTIPTAYVKKPHSLAGSW